jgi:hypothetical protein
MSTNTLPPAGNWQEFRDRFFELIESRRPIASTFKYSAVYFFMSRCMKAFNSPGTDKAQEALNAISDDGSFRLVADSRCDFLAMFPDANQPADDGDQPNPSDHLVQTQTSATVQPEVPAEDAVESGSGQVPRKAPQREPYEARASNPPAARHAVQPGDKPERATQRPVSARPWSGRPFRP